MTTQAQRNARAALDAARPAVARLDSTRGPEDLAADLIDIWSAVEAALRALVGSSTLTGQPLIREARQRQLIDFDQANSLAAFEAVHVRLQNTAYRPMPDDVNSARNAVAKLDAALVNEQEFAAPRAVPGATASAAATATAPVAETTVVTTAPVRSRPAWLWPALAALVIVIAVGAFLATRGGGSDTLNQGIAAYQHGQREVAVSDFTKASREDPKAAMPHVWLARMAREVGNFTLASQELQTALQLDPNNATALREMGANLLQQGNYDLARRFYVRAVQADPNDKMAQGYLGCTLNRLGRTREAAGFLQRAGPGAWSNCAPAVPAGTPQVAPGAVIPK